MGKRLLVLIAALPLLMTVSRGDDLLKGSNRFGSNGWIFVHLEGPRGQLGYQHSYLRAPEIGDLLRDMKTRPWTLFASGMRLNP